MDFLKLAAGLSVYNGGEYDGYVIGRAAVALSGKIVKTANRIRVERRNYVVMSVTGYNADREITGRLEVTMVKPPAGFRGQTGRWEPEKEEGAYRFTREQVDRYLLDVQDTNPIHRGKTAVVPGLLLVDFLLRQRIPVQKIRFVEPLWVGSSFVVAKEPSGIRILSVDRKICYAKL